MVSNTSRPVVIPLQPEMIGVDSWRAIIPGDAEERGIIAEIKILEAANVAQAICQAAERFGCDMICLGSNGRSGIAAMQLGSVSQAVLAQSHRPVLIVRAPVA